MTHGWRSIVGEGSIRPGDKRPFGPSDQIVERRTNIGRHLRKAGQTEIEAMRSFEMAIREERLLSPLSQNDQTSLCCAETNNHEMVLDLLLEYHSLALVFNNDEKNYWKRTLPLHWAAKGGHESVVKLLIESGKIEIDLKDADERTPL
jgi:hypothetical protein